MKVLMVSLGCDKNLVDSEVMLGLLHKAGHEITNDEHEAEAVVINTCAFIKDAQEESINTIRTIFLQNCRRLIQLSELQIMMRSWMQSDLKKNIPLLQISIICRRQLADVSLQPELQWHI